MVVSVATALVVVASLLVALENIDSLQALDVTGYVAFPGDAYAQIARVVLELSATDQITDDSSLVLDGASAIVILQADGRTYAAVVSGTDDGVQILDVTDPANIAVADNIIDNLHHLELNGPNGIDIFQIDGRTYAAVVGHTDTGVQILDVTDPFNIIAAGRITDDSSLALDDAWAIDTFIIGSGTYAAVVSYLNDGVQILNLTDPSNIAAAGQIYGNSSLALDGPYDVDTFRIDGRTYAAVASWESGGVQILDVTDPSNIAAVDQITDSGNLELRGAAGIDIFQTGGRTYAAVASISDRGVQILDVTDPSNIAAVDQITDDSSLVLNGAYGIHTFTIGSGTYAAVASQFDDGIQILDVTDPSNIAAVDQITDSGNLELGRAIDVDTFLIGGHTYAAVASYEDDGVQILQLTASPADTTPPANTVVLEPDGPLGPNDIGRITLTSSATGIIQAAWEEPDEEPANYRISWTKVGEPYLTWGDSAGNAFPTVPSHTITGLEEGIQYKVKMRASYDGTAGNWSGEAAITVAGTAANTPATGSPSITGTVQVGQTLTADASGIADANGMTNSTFRYQWISNDGTTDTDIAGATASSHVLAAGDQGRTIKVLVAFTDDAGHAESLTSAATQAVAPASTVPGAPTSLSVLPNGSGALAASWQAPVSNGGSSITGYAVQWKESTDSWDSSSDVSEATTTGTAHTITGLTDGTPYAVRVLATNGIGDGEPTPEETATPQAPAPPLGPRDIGVITLNGTTPGTIQASWEEPDEESANYRVSWTKVGEPYLIWTDSTGNAFPTVPSHTITGLEAGAEYKVRVRAIYDGNSGDWSGEVTVTVVGPITTNTPATGSPSITGTVQVGQALTADASGIADADGMTNSTLRYQWVSNDGTADTDIAGATASSHVLAAGDQGRTIKVRVAFTDDAGHAESLTSAATQAVAPASTVPGSPQNFAVSTNGSGTLAVSWQAPASDGGSSITGYAVQWKTASGSWTVPADVTGAASTGTTHTITGLTDGTPYAVRVLATNGIGDGEPTPEETATPQAPAPPLGPRDIGVITLSSTTPGTIQVSWEEPDEEPANYRVMWAKAGEPYLTWTDSTGNAFPTVPSHTITGLEEGVEYKMKVRASYDGTAGDWSGETTVTVASSTTNTATIPGSPQNLAVSTNGSGTLAVSWQASASDGGSSITGYAVQWKTASGSWTVPADVTEAATNGTTHTITGLTDGTLYAVRVLATNGIGDGEPTPEETATPQAPAPPLGPRDIGVITLSSTTPGTIQVSWDAPDEEPANYRVMWAKVGEPYLTWTDSSGNAFPTVPSHTITGLAEGVEYKMKVRASYDGTAGDWSGEVTITVARTG